MVPFMKVRKLYQRFHDIQLDSKIKPLFSKMLNHQAEVAERRL